MSIRCSGPESALVPKKDSCWDEPSFAFSLMLKPTEVLGLSVSRPARFSCNANKRSIAGSAKLRRTPFRIGSSDCLRAMARAWARPFLPMISTRSSDRRTRERKRIGADISTGSFASDRTRRRGASSICASACAACRLPRMVARSRSGNVRSSS